MREGEFIDKPDISPDVSLGDLVGQLSGEAREVARSQIALYKARALATVTRYKNAAILFSIAGVLALAGLIALLVGLILTLATMIGPGLATLAVTLGVVLLCAVLALVGKSRLS